MIEKGERTAYILLVLGLVVCCVLQRSCLPNAPMCKATTEEVVCERPAWIMAKELYPWLSEPVRLSESGGCLIARAEDTNSSSVHIVCELATNRLFDLDIDDGNADGVVERISMSYGDLPVSIISVQYQRETGSNPCDRLIAMHNGQEFVDIGFDGIWDIKRALPWPPSGPLQDGECTNFANAWIKVEGKWFRRAKRDETGTFVVDGERVRRVVAFGQDGFSFAEGEKMEGGMTEF